MRILDTHPKKLFFVCLVQYYYPDSSNNLELLTDDSRINYIYELIHTFFQCDGLSSEIKKNIQNKFYGTRIVSEYSEVFKLYESILKIHNDTMSWVNEINEKSVGKYNPIPDEDILDPKKNPNLSNFAKYKEDLLCKIVETVMTLPILPDFSKQIVEIKNTLLTGIVGDLQKQYLFDDDDVDAIFSINDPDDELVKENGDYCKNDFYFLLAEEIVYDQKIISTLVKKFTEHFAKDSTIQNKTQKIFEAVATYQPCLKEKNFSKNFIKEIQLSLKEKNIFEEIDQDAESNLFTCNLFKSKKFTDDDNSRLQLTQLKKDLVGVQIKYKARKNNFDFGFAGFKPSEKLISTNNMIAEVNRLMRIMNSPHVVIEPSGWVADAAAKEPNSNLKKLCDRLFRLKNMVEGTKAAIIELT